MKPAAIYFTGAYSLVCALSGLASLNLSIILICLYVLGYFWLKPDEPLPIEPEDNDENSSKLNYRPNPDRRNVTTDRFNMNKVDESGYDSIIIGSGLAGLSCGAMLSRMGRKVLVLEQHDVIGGGSHSFVLSKGSNNYRFDSGLHYCIPECGSLLQLCTGSEKVPVECRVMGEKILDGSSRQSKENKIKLENGLANQIGVAYDRVVFQNAEDDPFDFELWETHLPALFKRFPDPEDQATIKQWMKDADEATNGVPLFVLSKFLPFKWQKRLAPFLLTKFRKWASITTEEYFDKLTKNKRLASLLSSMWIDTGSPPHKCSFFMTAAVTYGFPKRGGAFPVGGAQAMSGSLVPVIEKNGGRVLVRADVKGILIREQAPKQFEAYGVELKSGQKILSSNVVSACGYLNTVNNLLAGNVVDSLSLPRSFPGLGLEQSLGFVMINIGLQGDAKELDIHNYNVWYLPAKENGDMFSSLNEFWKEPLRSHKALPIMVTFPSLKEAGGDSSHYTNTHTCQILITAEYSWFQKWATAAAKSGESRGDEYEKLKNEWKELSLNKLYELFPKIKEKNAVDFVDVSTPLSIEFYLREPQGGACGLDLTPPRFTDWKVQEVTDMKTPIKNLWLTGQDTVLCGQPLVQLAGIITAFRMGGFINSLKAIAQTILFTIPK